MTKRARPPIETCQPFICGYHVSFKPHESEAVLVRELTTHRNTISIRFYTIEELKEIHGILFAVTNKENLRRAPVMSITYFKICDGVYYYFIESFTNPICQVVQRNFLVMEKIRISKIDRDVIEFEIDENGFAPLCRLEANASKFKLRDDNT